MQQHVLDDGVGALAVLYDLVEIALQRIRHFVDFRARLPSSLTCQGLPQFLDEFDRNGREIVDEIKRDF